MRTLRFVALIAGVTVLSACADSDSISNPDIDDVVLVWVDVAGNGIDANGFTITILGNTHRVVPGDTLRLHDIAPGEYTVRLGDVASHCAAVVDSTAVRVEDGVSARAQLAAECHGRMVYTEWYGPYNDQLFYLDERGVSRKLTASQSGGQWSPRWSPAGTHVLYQRQRIDDVDIFVADLQGNTRPLAARVGDSESNASWSPDGQWIVYVHIAGMGGFTRSDLRLVRPDGSDDHSILNDGGVALSPVWSPDGAYIAFACWRRPHGICYVRPNGELIGQAPVQLFSPQNLSWSPDGARIVFEAIQQGRQTIQILEAYNGSIVDALPGALSYGQSHWSPDGKRLFITAVDFGEIATNPAYIVNADGTNPWRIADHTSWIGDWTPDGTKINVGFVSNTLHVGDTESGGLRALHSSSFAVGRGMWQPHTGASALAGAQFGALAARRPATVPLAPISQHMVELHSDATAMTATLKPVQQSIRD